MLKDVIVRFPDGTRMTNHCVLREGADRWLYVMQGGWQHYHTTPIVEGEEPEAGYRLRDPNEPLDEIRNPETFSWWSMKASLLPGEDAGEYCREAEMRLRQAAEDFEKATDYLRELDDEVCRLRVAGTKPCALIVNEGFYDALLLEARMCRLPTRRLEAKKFALAGEEDLPIVVAACETNYRFDLTKPEKWHLPLVFSIAAND